MDLIDIHTHILPGFDDGAQDFKDSLAMAEAAVKDGVNLLVATPRVGPSIHNVSKKEIFEQVKYLNQCLEYARVKLPVLPGALYPLAADLPKRMKTKQILTINDTGKYLLLELPPGPLPGYAAETVGELLQQGVTPILSCPERNQFFSKNPDSLKELARQGLASQVTAASITGRNGRAARKNAFTLIENGLVQLVASDGNRAEGRHPVLYAAFQEIERRLGIEWARTLISHNPFQVIQGLPLKAVPALSRESLWQKLGKITDV